MSKNPHALGNSETFDNCDEIPILYSVLCVLLKEIINSCLNDANISKENVLVLNDLLDGSCDDLPDIPIDIKDAGIGYPDRPLYRYIARKFYQLGVDSIHPKLSIFEMVDVNELDVLPSDLISKICSLVNSISDNMTVSDPCFGLPSTPFCENVMSFFSAEKPWNIFGHCQSAIVDPISALSTELLQFRYRISYSHIDIDSNSLPTFTIPSDIFQNITTIIKHIDIRALLYLVGMRSTIGSILMCPPPRDVLERSFTIKHRSESTSILTVGARYICSLYVLYIQLN
jgi:hypothetical protein